jgi:uncharacterized protein YbaR (Trm112 family)
VPRSVDLLLGKLAVREGFCTQAQVDECLQMQSMTRSEAPLGDLLLFKGYLTAPQLKTLLARQHKRILACPACRLSFTVVTLSDGKSARCPRCKGPLEAVPDAGPTRTDAEFATRKVPVVPLSSGPAARQTCVVCDHQFESARDLSGRVHCPSCRSSFSPR